MANAPPFERAEEGIGIILAGCEDNHVDGRDETERIRRRCANLNQATIEAGWNLKRRRSEMVNELLEEGNSKLPKE